MDLEAIKSEFDPKFEEQRAKAADLNKRLDEAKEGSDSEAVKALQTELGEVTEAVKGLEAEREEKLREAQIESLTGDVQKLTEAIKGITTDDRFEQVGELGEEHPYKAGAFYSDAHKALVGHDKDAMERWTEVVGEKAMTEGTGTTGGLLVPDQISSELLELKVQQTVLRGLFSSVQVNSDTLRIAGQTQGLVAGWVAELAEKPLSDLAFGEISVNTFTKAGMAVVSNQLLQDANRSVQSLINSDLAKRLALLEEDAFVNGTGTGQPLGILNTPGVATTEVTGTFDVAAIVDAIIDAITAVYTEYLAPPNAIVMHPALWGEIVKAHRSSSDDFLIGPPERVGGRQATDRLPGYGAGPYPTGSLYGYPVYTTPVVPTTAGGSNNQTRVIVGNFREGLILDHSGVTLAASEHVYFTSNQTIFRAEDRVGFTAGRYPKAFNVLGGSGLVLPS